MRRGGSIPPIAKGEMNMKFTLDLESIYYILRFHKSPRYKQAEELLQPLSLALYTKEYILACERLGSMTKKQEQDVHNRCLNMANKI